MSETEQEPDFLPEIRVGRIKVLKIYQISDDELTGLEQGAGHSLFLNLGISVLSMAASFLISLLTATNISDRLFYIFVIVTVVGFLAGLVLMILWWNMRKPIYEQVRKIRDRMPPEGEAQKLKE